MNYKVIKVFTDNSGKAVSYLVTNGQHTFEATKDGIFNAVSSGNTFVNASVNLDKCSLRVNGDVPREKQPAKKELKIWKILAPSKGMKASLVIAQVGEKRYVYSPEEFNIVSEDPKFNFDKKLSKSASYTYLDKFQKKLFNSQMLLGSNELSDAAIESLVGGLILAHGNNASAYLIDQISKIPAGNKRGAAYAERCKLLMRAKGAII